MVMLIAFIEVLPRTTWGPCGLRARWVTITRESVRNAKCPAESETLLGERRDPATSNPPLILLTILLISTKP